ncbi:hypothetical protein LAV73_12005 [Lysinibacillus xylanilyticus]|uniref:hypothetical protein n=1 Tax=Lysinibacillus xylanilyticus TaxID=582475 RepID=UPI002B241570|nr:hypothetical protein [Lysinibacillus xylanilyticus]MEB2280721.1 hypothetical protein [Lysinibacillus xylanilyticus]
MKTRLEKLIISLNFTEAKALVDSLNKVELENYMLELCYESENIIYYSFVFDMLKSKETSFLHYIASIILSQPLSHLEGAYQAAFYHAKKAVELDEEDIELKEYLLFFNDIPDKLLSNQEAKTIAEEIINLNPTSKVAKQYI